MTYDIVMRNLIWAFVLVGCGGSEFGALSVELDAADSMVVDGTLTEDHDTGSSENADGNVGDVLGTGGADGGSGLDGDVDQDADSPGSGGAPESGGASNSGGTSWTGGAPNSGGATGSGGAAGTCTTGAVRCSGAQPQTCVGGVWLGNGSICSGALPACLDGVCVACTPGDRSCASPTDLRVCTASGVWSTASCEAPTTECVDGACDLPCDGAGLSTHHTGTGLTWTDCVPVGTHSSDQAEAACTTWCAGKNNCSCWAPIFCGIRMFASDIVGDASGFVGWAYQADHAGEVWHVNEINQTSCSMIGEWN